MQSLNISTSALKGIQLALDNVSNNIANIDTVGYKRRGTTFSELLVDNMNSQPKKDRTGRNTQPGLRIPGGVRVGYTPLDLSQGSAKSTEVPTDLMIEGEGYFVVLRENGTNPSQREYHLTRNGAFQMKVMDNETFRLMNAAGDYLVDESGNPIEIPVNSAWSIDANGTIMVNGAAQGRIPLWKVANPDQYRQVGNNEFLVELAAGQQLQDVFPFASGSIRQGYLELSNVDMTREMSQLIVAQRAYQLNARAVILSDQMMGIANSLRGQ